MRTALIICLAAALVVFAAVQLPSQLQAHTTNDGAQFWVYVSPTNDTHHYIFEWTVTITSEDQSWSGEISSEVNPRKILKTPGLSGVFTVEVAGAGRYMLLPRRFACLPDSSPAIGCNSNCTAMVGIVASHHGEYGNYWTVWNAICPE